MKKLFILISAISVLAACQREVALNNVGPVQIRISTGGEIGGARTRANSYADNAVARVDVLVFNNSAAISGGDHLRARLSEVKHAYNKGGDLYNVTLKAGTNLDLYFAINAKAIIENASLNIGDNTGDTWEEVRKKLIMSPATMINRPEYGLPMWGYRYGETINSNAASNYFGTVYMTRAVATADVEITATNFSLMEGSVEYITDKGYLGYLVDAANFRVDPSETEPLNIDKPQLRYWLTAPQIPADATTGNSPNDYRVFYTLDKDATSATYDGNNITGRLYFFENDGPNSETAPTNGRNYTKLVLKGIWDDPDVANDTKVTYYPLAFRDRNENGDNINERANIVRNRQFKFKIINVNGHGYENLEDAKKGNDLNMQYEIIPWDNWGQGDLEVGSDSRWLSLSPSRNKTEVKRASLYRNATSTDEIYYTTNYDPKGFALALTQSGAPVALTAADTDAKIIAKVANEFYEIALVYTGENTDGESEGKFIFTARKDYDLLTPESIITISNPYVKFLLKVDQENSSPEDWSDGGDQHIVW